jgi:hypothetical protein
MQMSVKPRVFIIQKAAVYITKILSIFGKFLNAFIVRLVHCILFSVWVVYDFTDLNPQICGSGNVC